jgi:signal transduction histidine kinase
MVEITIADNGTGMSEDVRQQIFDPFFTTKRVGKGTGQGLAICRDVVVAKHGGRISVDSTPGEGSRFSVMLPIQHLKPAAEEDA